MTARTLMMLAFLTTCIAAVPRKHGIGANFLQSAAMHPASGDMLMLSDPGNGATKPVSIAVVESGTPPGSDFWTLPVVDNGSVVSYPTDLAFSGDAAFIVDQGAEGIAAFNRTSSGQWKFWKKWLLKDLLPDCDAGLRQFGQPEAIAVTQEGALYVSMTVSQMKRCLLHPLTKCCESSGSSSAVMRFHVSQDGSATMKEVFYSSSFFKLDDGTDMHYHIRGMDVADNGDILVAGYGDMGTDYGHTVWRWNAHDSVAQCIAGKRQGPGGHAGDGGNATAALLNLPWGIVAVSDSVYISEAAMASTDVRHVVGGRISTYKNAPHNASSFDNDYFRKLHRGRSSATLLLSVSGLGSNEGHVVEFDLESNEATVMV